MIRGGSVVCVAAASLALAAPAVSAPLAASGYPTEARVDYVLGCMAANGQTQDAMRRCSCSIDTIAAILPYQAYERAETVMRMRGMSGEAAGMFRDTKVLRDVVDQLRVAQVEADFRCF